MLSPSAAVELPAAPIAEETHGGSLASIFFEKKTAVNVVSRPVSGHDFKTKRFQSTESDKQQPPSMSVR